MEEFTIQGQRVRYCNEPIEETMDELCSSEVQACHLLSTPYNTSEIKFRATLLYSHKYESYGIQIAKKEVRRKRWYDWLCYPTVRNWQYWFSVLMDDCMSTRKLYNYYIDGVERK
jgi:hypothetical protein